MPKKKFKLAIMGATHVGKTVFLASYFHLVELGKGKYAISPKPVAVAEISRITKTLFEEGRVVSGTVERKDLSFSVGRNLNIDVELHDIPGGFSTDAASWEKETTRIADDLSSADGALFFISAEDVYKGNGRTTEETNAFTASIDLLRQRNKNDGRQRADIPIFVIFTKCDAIPSDVTKEDLLERIVGLMRNIRDTRKGDSLFDSSFFFSKGRNVATYKSIAMGKWKDSETPPSSDSYEPENVLEPMEDMFERMVSAGKKRDRLYFKLAVAALILVWSATIAVSAGIDNQRWRSAVDSAERYISVYQYEDAIKALDSFKSRLLPPTIILPPFLRAGDDADSIIGTYYKQYEAYLFKELQPALQAVDMTQKPQGNLEFIKESARKTEEYLNHGDFFEIAPSNYRQVKEADYYYVTALTLVTTAEEIESSVDPLTLYALISKQLGVLVSVPEEWRDSVMNKIDAALRGWVRSLPQNPEISLVSRYIDDAEVLMQNQLLPVELRNLLAMSIEKWSAQIKDIWASNVTVWIKEAAQEPDAESGIVFLKSKRGEAGIPEKEQARIDVAVKDLTTKLVRAWSVQAQNLDDAEKGILLIKEKIGNVLVSGEERRNLEQVIDDLYAKFIAQLNHSNMPIEVLRDRLAAHPDMPAKYRDTVEKKISLLISESVASTTTMLNKVSSIKELEHFVPKFVARLKELPEGASELNNSFASVFKRMLMNELDLIDRRFGARAADRDFAVAFDEVQKGYVNIGRTIDGFEAMTDSLQLGKRREEVAKRWRESLSSLEEAEFLYCKASFDKVKHSSSSGSINTLMGNLDAFINRWPASTKNSEVSMVRDFVKTVSNGIPARITIVEGYFPEDGRWLEKNPDTHAEIFIDGSSQGVTDTKNDTKRPQFNAGCEFVWKVNSQIQIKVFEDDVFEDHLFFDRTVYATGLFGYERLTAELSSGGNKLHIRFDPKGTIPPSPWK